MNRGEGADEADTYCGMVRSNRPHAVPHLFHPYHIHQQHLTLVIHHERQQK